MKCRELDFGLIRQVSLAATESWEPFLNCFCLGNIWLSVIHVICFFSSVDIKVESHSGF